MRLQKAVKLSTTGGNTAAVLTLCATSTVVVVADWQCWLLKSRQPLLCQLCEEPCWHTPLVSFGIAGCGAEATA